MSMVNMDTIERGVAAYADNELMPKLPEEGLQKVLIGTMLGLGIRKFKTIAGAMMEEHKEGLKMLGIMDESGNVDIDTLKEEFRKNIGDNGFSVELPMMGKMTFHRSDVDTLYKYITGGTN